ncbi:MAG TPA: hypothetical protein VJJ20_03300 [Candidatus Paceibacterota bacterium]
MKLHDPAEYFILGGSVIGAWAWSVAGAGLFGAFFAACITIPLVRLEIYFFREKRVMLEARTNKHAIV